MEGKEFQEMAIVVTFKLYLYVILAQNLTKLSALQNIYLYPYCKIPEYQAISKSNNFNTWPL